MSGNYARVGSFLSQTWGLSAQTLSNYGIKTVTISMSDDSSGRPVAFTASGQSSTVHLSVTQTSGQYNQPVSIRAPR